MSESQFCVVTRNLADDSDMVNLARFAPISELKYSYGTNGCLSASWSQALDIDFNDRSILIGRKVEIYEGLCLRWAGTLADPGRGYPWQFTADGFASQAANFLAVYDTTTMLRTGLYNILYYAQQRGLPWLVSGSGGYGATPAALPDITQDFAMYISDLLDLYAAAAGQSWWVGPDRMLQFIPVQNPNPDFYVTSNDMPFSRVFDNYATDLFVAWIDATSGTKQIVEAANTTRQILGQAFGVKEQILDLTDLGPITNAVGGGTGWDVASLGNSVLSQMPIHAGYGGTLSVVAYQAATFGAGDGFHDVAGVTSHQLARCIGCAPSLIVGDLNPLMALDVPIAQTEYDVDSQTLTITPVGFVATDFQSILSNAHALASGSAITTLS